MTLLIYGPGSRRELCRCHDNDRDWHIDHHNDQGREVRCLRGTHIEDACALADERIPRTVEEFDSMFPGQKV